MKELALNQDNRFSKTHNIIGSRLEFHRLFTYDDMPPDEYSVFLGFPQTSWNTLRQGKREFTLSELQNLGKIFNTGIAKIISGNF
jgi:hypothetical protein